MAPRSARAAPPSPGLARSFIARKPTPQSTAALGLGIKTKSSSLLPSTTATTSPPPSLLGAPTVNSPIAIRHDADSGNQAQEDEDTRYEPLRKKIRAVATLPITPLPPSTAQSSSIVTSKDVREKATGRPLPSYATPDGPAIFTTPQPKFGSSFSSFASTTITKSSEDKPLTFGASPTYDLSASLSLPTHYATLLALHSALEHALIAHLAVTGPGGALGGGSPNVGSPSSTTSPSSARKAKVERSTERIVRMPALLAFSTLRPLVERAAARRLGHAELARLVGLWGGGSEAEPKDDGIGLFISRVKALDARGRKGWDWAVGIEVRLSRPRRQATPPLSASFGSLKAPVTPPSSKSSASTDARAGQAAREGMSVVALWNTGLETRKMAVKTRLLEWLGKAHEAWLDANPSLHASPSSLALRPSTPEPHQAVQGQGGLLTPAATREGEGNKRATRTVVLDNATLGPRRASSRVTVGSAAAATSSMPITITTTSTSTSGWQRPTRGETLSAWHPLFPLADAPLPPAAELPSLSGFTSRHGKALGGGGAAFAPRPSLAERSSDSQTKLDTSSLELTPGPAPAPRALTLEERIRAKEQARKHGISLLAAKSGVKASAFNSSTVTTGAGGGGDLMASFKRRSTLSRLDSIAEGLYMLFLGSASASSGSGASGSAPGKRSSMLPLPDVLGSIAKSSAVALSRAEAAEALQLLQELTPGFVSVSTVAGRQWACLEDGAQLKLVREAVRKELKG